LKTEFCRTNFVANAGKKNSSECTCCQCSNTEFCRMQHLLLLENRILQNVLANAWKLNFYWIYLPIVENRILQNALKREFYRNVLVSAWKGNSKWWRRDRFW
jgi:hypothetical protein